MPETIVEEEVRVRGTRGPVFPDPFDPGRGRDVGRGGRPDGTRGGRVPVPTPTPTPEPIPEVVVEATPGARPPPDTPLTWRGYTATAREWERVFRERVDVAEEVIRDLETEENKLYREALEKFKGDVVQARAWFRKQLLKAGYAAEELGRVISRIEGAIERGARAVAPELTEIVVSAARSPIARAAASVPAAGATMIVEGLLAAGGYLSGRALENQLRRNRRQPPPPTMPAPAPLPTPTAAPAPAPTTSPVPEYIAFPDQYTVTVSAPRPTPRAPVSAPLPSPLQFAFPTRLTGNPVRTVPFNLPQSPTRGASLPSPRTPPRSGSRPGLTPFNPPGVASPLAMSSPDPCNCGGKQQKKKRKKPSPRNVCYTGTYRELRSGLIKRRREQIPCE